MMKKMIALTLLGLTGLLILVTVNAFGSGPRLIDRIAAHPDHGALDLDSLQPQVLGFSANGDFLAMADSYRLTPHHGILPYVIPPIRIRNLSEKRFEAEWSPKLSGKQTLHETHIFHFEYSGDGKYALVCWRPRESGQVTHEILDTSNWTSVAKVSEPLDEVMLEAFVNNGLGARHLSHDGTYFMFCTPHKEYERWRVHVRSAQSPDRDLLCVAHSKPELSPDGRYVAVMNRAGGTDVYEVEAGGFVTRYEHLLVQRKVWSPKFARIAMLEETKRNSIVLIEVRSNKKLADVVGLAWGYCDDGKTLATTDGPNIRLWRADSGERIAEFEVNTRKSIWTAGNKLPATLFTSGGRLLCFLESDGDDFQHTSMRFVDTQTAQLSGEAIRLPKHAGISLSPQDKYFVISNLENKQLDVWTVLNATLSSK